MQPMVSLSQSSALWEMLINPSTVSAVRRFEISCNSKLITPMPRRCCWSRTIAQRRTSSLPLTLLSLRMNLEKRRISGRILEQVHLLSDMSQSLNMTRVNSSRVRFAVFKIKMNHSLAIPQSSIAPMRNLASLKKSLCELLFHTR